MQIIKKYCPRFHRIVVKELGGKIVYYNQWWFIWWHYYWHEIGYQCLSPEYNLNLPSAYFDFYRIRNVKKYHEIAEWTRKMDTVICKEFELKKILVKQNLHNLKTKLLKIFYIDRYDIVHRREE